MGVEEQEALQSALEATDPEEIIKTEGEQKPNEEAAAPPAKGSKESAAEDPEIELQGGTKIKKSVLDNYEVEVAPGKKVKLTDLQKGYMLQEDYTKKTTALSAKEKGVQEIINWIGKVRESGEDATKVLIAFTEKALGNPEKLKKMLTALEDTQAAIEVKEDDIEKELEGMDPDDPAYKTQKNLLLKIKQLGGMVNTLQGQLENKNKADADNFRKIQESEKQKEFNKSVESAQNALTVNMKALVEEQKEVLNTDRKKALWSRMVIAYLREHPEKYDSEDVFVSRIKEIGKDAANEIKAMSEEVLASYLEKKKSIVKPPAPSNAEGTPPADETLQDTLERELGSLVQSKT